MQDPMQAAAQLVRLERRRKTLKAELDIIEAEQKELKRQVLDAIEEGRFPRKAEVEGATVFMRSQVWAGPKDGDHHRLASVLQSEGLVEYLPSTVNTQSLSGFVRDYLADDETLELEDRLTSLFETHPHLRDALNVTERHDVRINGA